MGTVPYNIIKACIFHYRNPTGNPLAIYQENARSYDETPFDQIKGQRQTTGLIAQTAVMQVGTVDDQGVLYKATQPGKLTDGFLGKDGKPCHNVYQTLAESCATNLDRMCAGQRPITERVEVDGWEKLVLGPYEWITYGEYFNVVESFGAGLVSRIPTYSKGDTIVIYADTQRAWMQAAYGAWRQGAIVGTIYATLGEEGALFGLNQSRCKIVVADGKLLKILGKIAKQFTTVKDVIAIQPPDDSSRQALEAAGVTIYLMDDVLKAGAENPNPPTPAEPDDVAVLMYTSGTTGAPKGVLITHKAIMAVMGSTSSPNSAVRFNGRPMIRPGAVYLAYLPLAHIMELAVEITLFSQVRTPGACSVHAADSRVRDTLRAHPSHAPRPPTGAGRDPGLRHDRHCDGDGAQDGAACRAEGRCGRAQADDVRRRARGARQGLRGGAVQVRQSRRLEDHLCLQGPRERQAAL